MQRTARAQRARPAAAALRRSAQSRAAQRPPAATTRSSSAARKHALAAVAVGAAALWQTAQQWCCAAGAPGRALGLTAPLLRSRVACSMMGRQAGHTGQGRLRALPALAPPASPLPAVTAAAQRPRPKAPRSCGCTTARPQAGPRQTPLLLDPGGLDLMHRQAGTPRRAQGRLSRAQGLPARRRLKPRPAICRPAAAAAVAPPRPLAAAPPSPPCPWQHRSPSQVRPCPQLVHATFHSCLASACVTHCIHCDTSGRPGGLCLGATRLLSAAHAPPTHLPSAALTPPTHPLCTAHTPPMHLPRTSHAPPMHFPCTSHAPHKHSPCTSHALSMHLPCTSHAPPMHLTNTGHAPRMHLLCTSHAPPMHNPRTSHAPPMHLPCTSQTQARRSLPVPR